MNETESSGGKSMSIDDLFDGMLHYLDQYADHLERDSEVPVDYANGFGFARDLARDYHLRKSSGVSCDCDDGSNPDRNVDGDWYCTDCGSLLMSRSEDADTGPD